MSAIIINLLMKIMVHLSFILVQVLVFTSVTVETLGNVLFFGTFLASEYKPKCYAFQKDEQAKQASII